MNINTFEFFSQNASALVETKNESKAIKETLPSLTHQVAWSAFAILHSGSNDAKLALGASIAKDAPYNTLKGAVAMAKKVLAYLEANPSIEVKEESISLEDAVQCFNDDVLPSLTINALYKVVNAQAKEEEAPAKRERLIRKEAIAMLNATPKMIEAGIKANSSQFDLHKDKVRFLEDAAVIVDARLAVEAKANAETPQESIARIVAEIASLGIANEVLEALTTNSVAVAA